MYRFGSNTILANGVLECPKYGGWLCGKPSKPFSSFLERNGCVQHDFMVHFTSEIDFPVVHQVVENFRHNILHAVKEALVTNLELFQHP